MSWHSVKKDSSFSLTSSKLAVSASVLSCVKVFAVVWPSGIGGRGWPLRVNRAGSEP